MLEEMTYLHSTLPDLLAKKALRALMAEGMRARGWSTQQQEASKPQSSVQQKTWTSCCVNPYKDPS